MAISFFLPGETSSYQLPAGNFRFEFYVKDPSNSITNINARLLKMGNLKMQFEVEPTNQKFRFSYLDVEFYFDSFFDDGGEFTNNLGELLVTIYRNDAPYFYGFIDPNTVRKSDWYYDKDNSALKWNKIKFRIMDALAYYQYNKLTMRDVQPWSSYVINMLEYICQFVSATPEPLNYTSGVLYSCPECPATTAFTYYVNDLTHDTTRPKFGDMQVMEYLNAVQKILGIVVFNYNGNYYLFDRVHSDGQPGEDIDVNKILKIEKIGIEQQINYVEVKATKDWSEHGAPGLTHEHKVTVGNSGAAENTKIILDVSGYLINNLYYRYKGDLDMTITIDPDNDDGGYTYFIDADGEWCSGGVELGMIGQEDAYTDDLLIVDLTPNNCNTEYPFRFDFATTGQFHTSMWRITWPNNTVTYCIQQLIERLAFAYQKLYFGINDFIRFSYAGIDDFLDIAKRRNIPGVIQDGILKKASIDFEKNVAKLEIQTLSPETFKKNREK